METQRCGQSQKRLAGPEWTPDTQINAGDSIVNKTEKPCVCLLSRESVTLHCGAPDTTCSLDRTGNLLTLNMGEFTSGHTEEVMSKLRTE